MIVHGSLEFSGQMGNDSRTYRILKLIEAQPGEMVDELHHAHVRHVFHLS